MSGTLNQHIIHRFKVQFEENCISLLLDSYSQVVDKKELKELSENNITIQLVGLMKTNPLRKELEISVTRESYLDSEDAYAGITEADKSPRIDIKYSTWKFKDEFEYHIEAKNLSENNWTKTNVTTPVNAKKLQKRYISTGMQNFISGRYPNGCLVGYITEGIVDNIVGNINTLLNAESRVNENLVKKHGGFTEHYISSHTGSSINELKHFFLEFI